MFTAGNDRALPFILLIDDDLVSREVMATVLTMSGFTVQTAEDGAASLELLAGRGFVPGLILLDAQMPGLSGNRLIAELRVHTQAPIVAISASNPPPALSAACDGFLRKPFAAGELKALLDQHDANKAARTAQQATGRGFTPGEAPEPAPSTAADSAVPVVNAQTLAELRQLMPDTAVRQIYAALVTDLTQRQTALRAAMARGDKAEIRRIGHAIKGGCAMAGALEGARLGAEIESNGLDDEDNQLDNITRLLRDLGTAVRNLERMLDSEFTT
jgi:DNA-binding response OmpR family regulator